MLARTDGRQQSPVEPQDVGAILGAFPGLASDRPMPAGTRIGPNHLHVGDLAPAAGFYERLGFIANPTAGLHHLQLHYADGAHLQRVLAALSSHGIATQELDGRAGAALADPSGNAIELTWAGVMEIARLLPPKHNREMMTSNSLSLTLLSLLGRLEARDGPALQARDLAVDLGISPGKVSRHLNTLQAMGLLTRRHNSDDGRALLPPPTHQDGDGDVGSDRHQDPSSC